MKRPQGADIKCILFQMLKKIKFYDWEACGLDREMLSVSERKT